MTHKLRLILLIILGLILTAMICRNAALVWMALPFLFYILTGLLTIPREICLSAHRIISHQKCNAGTLITMTLVVENKGRNIPSFQVHESLSPQIHLVSKSTGKYGELPFQGKTEIIYTFQATRGKYYWDKIQVSVSDPFCIFEQKLELPAEGEVVVLPDEMPEIAFTLYPGHTRKSPGQYVSNQPGSGVNYLGVREYSPGDPLRCIHWRLSARHPKQLFSKEFEREEMADVGLIVDGSATMNLKFGTEELFDSSVQAAAIIARSIIRGGNRLSLLVLGDRVLRVFPGTGRYQLERVLHKLAVSQPGENVSLNTLKYLPVKLFPCHALVILVSPLHPGDVPAVARLLACGYQVVIVSPDPVKFAGRGSHQPLAVRAATVERAALLWRLQKIGAHVLNWPILQQGSIEHERPFSSIQSEVNLTHNQAQSRKSIDWIWFPSVLLVLLICAAGTGVMSGISAALMIALAALALLIWEYMEQIAIRRVAENNQAHDFPSWGHARLLIATIGMSLFLAEGGLLVKLPLPFGVVLLAALLILFCFYRFYRLIIR